MLKSLCGVLLAFVLALAVAPDVGAKPRSVVLSGSQMSMFQLRGSDGYRVNVITEGRKVEVAASHPRNGIANYIVRGRKHGMHGFEATLPGLGRIAVEFHPVGKPRKVPPFKGCTGKPGRLETGRFVGVINFHGERNYTEVTATRAKGQVFSTRPQTCPVEGGGGGGGNGFNELLDATLSATAPKQGLVFTAGRVEVSGEAVTSYTAAQLSHHRGLKIIRAVTTGDLQESFTAEHTGRTATARVEPRDPFSGTADFAVQPDGTVNWTGDLSVTFPGTGPIRLTGKRFRTQLCVKDKCAGNLPQANGRFAAAGRLSALSSAAPTPRLWPR